MNKNFDYGKTYYKVMNSTENHYGLQYDDGLIIDHRPFGKMYYDNGIHFSTIENILAHTYIEDARYIREIIVPEDAEVIKQSVIKYKANKVILGQRFDIDDEEDMNYLLSIGMDVHVLSDLPLTNACVSCNTKMIKYLVSTGADMHFKNDLPLMIACKKGDLDVVKYLVEKGVDINVNNADALMYACEKNRLNVVEYLIEHGIDTTKILYYLQKFINRDYLDLVKFIIEKELNISINDESKLIEIGKNYTIGDFVKYLNHLGADINKLNEAYLFNSCRYGDKYTVMILARLGADVHIQNEKALLLATYYDKLDIIRYLVIYRKADVNVNKEELLKTAKGKWYKIYRFLKERMK